MSALEYERLVYRGNFRCEVGADFTFSNIDRKFGRLVATHGEGVPVEVFGYWPAVDPLLSLRRGTTKAPKEMSRARHDRLPRRPAGGGRRAA